MEAKYANLIKLWTQNCKDKKFIPHTVIKKLVSEIIFRETGININDQILDLIFDTYSMVLSVLLKENEYRKVSFLNLGWIRTMFRQMKQDCVYRFRVIIFKQSSILKKRFKAWENCLQEGAEHNENMSKEEKGGI